MFANIKISNVPLGNAFNQVYHVLGKFEAYGRIWKLKIAQATQDYCKLR